MTSAATLSLLVREGDGDGDGDGDGEGEGEGDGEAWRRDRRTRVPRDRCRALREERLVERDGVLGGVVCMVGGGWVWGGESFV